MRALFVSDCHLSITRPQAGVRFQRFLKEIAASTDALYILGDLFHCWIGDDADDPDSVEICNVLKEFARHAPVYFIRGNHDFMVGGGFELRSGCKLLPDKYRLNLDGREVLLMHGDLLCTNDRTYQNYRRVIQNPICKQILMQFSIKTRLHIADWIRRKTSVFNQNKPLEIMDVNQNEVVKCMREYDVQLLIHGHTHLRDEHIVHFDNGGSGRRIVLGDWGMGDQVTGNALVIEDGETSWLPFAG